MHSSQWILEARGDTVPFTLNIQLPKGLLRGGLQLSLTPYLKQDSLKTPFTLFTKDKGSSSPESIILTGPKARTVSIEGYFMNFPQFKNSAFVIEWQATNKGKVAPLPQRIVGYGISQLFHDAAPICTIKPGFNPAIIREKIEAIPSDKAIKPYLLAIMSARLYDATSVQRYLESAFAKDSLLKEKAKSDVEFIGYRKESWFQTLIQ